MDQWLAAIEADRSSLPHERKVTRNKPAAARDACVVDGVEYDWTPGSVCDAKFTYTGLIRMTAGGPVTNDVLKCQLKPLNRLDYNVSFTDAQWATATLNRYQAEGLRLASAGGEVRRGDLMARCRISRESARRTLASLVELGLLRRLGSGGRARGTSFGRLTRREDET